MIPKQLPTDERLVINQMFASSRLFFALRDYLGAAYM
jgi:hypothetical protein